MISRNHFPRLLAAVIIALAATVVAKNLRAQAIFTNPPCAAIAVVNNHPTCAATINLVTVPAGVWPSFNLPAGAGLFLPMPAGGTVKVIGIIPPGSPAVAFSPPPPTFAGCNATSWWAVNLQLSSGCRFKVCVDPATCSIKVF